MCPIQFQPKVLGRWKDFEFQMITDPSQYPAVLDHLHKNFFNSTPLTRCLEKSQEYWDEFDKIYLSTLPQNLSFCAVHLKTKEIAGLRITYVQDRALEQKFASFGFQTKQMKVMNTIMGTVNKKAKIYEKYGITSFVNFYTACVDPKYRGQGLATELYVRALEMVREREVFKHVKSNLTSPYTRRICEKFGFKELARVYYNDFKDDDGIPLLKGATDDEFVSFMCLEL